MKNGKDEQRFAFPKYCYAGVELSSRRPLLQVTDDIGDVFRMRDAENHDFKIVLARTRNGKVSDADDSLIHVLVNLDVSNVVVLDFAGLAGNDAFSQNRPFTGDNQGGVSNFEPPFEEQD